MIPLLFPLLFPCKEIFLNVLLKNHLFLRVYGAKTLFHRYQVPPPPHRSTSISAQIPSGSLCPTMGFSYFGNSKKSILSSRRSQWGSGVLLAHFGEEKAILEQTSVKLKFCNFFKTFFSSVLLQNININMIKCTNRALKNFKMAFF